MYRNFLLSSCVTINSLALVVLHYFNVTSYDKSIFVIKKQQQKNQNISQLKVESKGSLRQYCDYFRDALSGALSVRGLPP